MSEVVTQLDGWVLRQIGRGVDAPDVAPEVVAVRATVPGCVHTDLMAAGVIVDPFPDLNEAEVAWVASCDWAYSCTFEATREMLDHERIDVIFDGLDTLATITVNGVVVAETANMHRRYRFDITHVVAAGSNTLTVSFASATVHVERVRAAAQDEMNGEWPSASFGRSFNFLRKMACSWGWDWGPWLTTAGIWRPVSIVAWSTAQLGDIRTHAFDDEGTWRLAVDIATTVAQTNGPCRIRATLTDLDGQPINTAEGLAGAATTHVELGAPGVEVWEPHSHGAQPLYELVVELFDDQGRELDRASKRIGFRTIDLDTSADANGSAFTFVVNGRPIFARGVNWIPDDIFVTRVTDDDYRQRLQQAVDANVDMIRVWGGGIYEDDRFYDICDELGLLVWQDFAFACAAYPEHLLRDEVEAEARDNVSRLMHHASLAIWNGNNENIWGYWDWGWKGPLQGNAWGAGFYHDLLPTVCGDLDPTRPYWPGSPWSGSSSVAPNADAHGCVHVWDVWNQIDLIRYRDHTPRFVAEFGWQAPPSWPTMADAVSGAEFRRDSPAMRNHQKAAEGDTKLDRGIRRRFGQIDDIEAFWYAAQVVQARAVQTGIEHFRSLRPYCMGTIWWQLNDCWPVASWSVVDSAGRPKPSWFALRQAYRPRLLTIQPRGDQLVLFAINDSDTPWQFDGEIRRETFDGGHLATVPVAARVMPGSTWSIPIDETVARATDPTSEVLVAGELGSHADELALWWYADDTDLRLRQPNLHVEHEVARRGDAIELSLSITADTVVRDLAVYPERIAADGRVNRQLIQLLPGRPESITISGVSESHLADLMRQPVCWHIASLLER